MLSVRPHAYRCGVDPTPDAFHALARSSPWRWRTLHFTHRGTDGEVEAWVRRPGRLRVRRPGKPDLFESGVPYTRGWVSTDPDFVPPEPKVPQDVEPTWRPDGLVAERPTSMEIDYDDPMYGNFSWVAMLDPVELSHHVDVSDLRATEVGGRLAWRAFLRAEEGYDARCGGNCCELLYSDVSRRAEFADPADAPPPRPGVVYPDGYDVALDVQTGVVVRCLPVGGDADSPWLEVDIHEVDADVDHLFPPD